MSQTKIKNKTIHQPVLLQEVLDTLKPQLGEKYLDLTAGYGGHASAIIELTHSEAVLVDRDENAIKELDSIFANTSQQVSLLHMDYYSACRKLVDAGEKFDLVLVDLGVSSPHLDNASRGFSLQSEAPLDMRMDPSQDLTAYTVVNEYSQDELVRILKDYGEEPKARAMAKIIVDSRPVQTTSELAHIGKKVWPGHSRSHPATRLFQAIRIEVNDELGQLEKSLPLMVELLNPGGRLAIISFHSLEDRIVKRFLSSIQGDRYDAVLEAITKKPLQATQNELVFNPRARSAKIRVSKRK